MLECAEANSLIQGGGGRRPFGIISVRKGDEMWKKMALLMVLLVASGCYSTPHRLPEIAYPAPQAGKKSLEYQIDWLVVTQTGRAELGRAPGGGGGGALARTYAHEEFERSGLFDRIADIPLGGTFGEAELVLQIQIVNRANPRPGLAFLCGFTLTLIPSYATDEWTMTTTVRRWSGGKMVDERSIVLRDEMNTWMEFFLLFQAPFADSDSTVAEATLRNMFRHLLNKLRESGTV
jgi:hypothetical protein